MDNNSENNKQPPIVNFVRNLPPFLYVIIVLGIIFFLYQIIGAGLTVAAGGVEFEKNIQITRLVLSFSQFMFILAPTVFFTRLQTRELKKTLRLNLPSPYLLFLAVMGIIFIQPLLQGYMAVQESILNHIPFLSEALKHLKSLFDLVEQAMIKLVKAYSPAEFAVVVFVIAVTPAVCEEILFRGFVMKNLEKVSKPSIAIFLTGFLFAIYHFEPFNILPLIALGCFLAFVVYYSNSIYLGIICHFLNNFFASFFLYKYGKEDIETPHFSQSETMDAIITVSVSLILFLGAMLLFYQMRYKEREAEIE